MHITIIIIKVIIEIIYLLLLLLSPGVQVIKKFWFSRSVYKAQFGTTTKCMDYTGVASY